jgi:hypothetical protein
MTPDQKKGLGIMLLSVVLGALGSLVTITYLVYIGGIN